MPYQYVTTARPRSHGDPRLGAFVEGIRSNLHSVAAIAGREAPTGAISGVASEFANPHLRTHVALCETCRRRRWSEYLFAAPPRRECQALQQMGVLLVFDQRAGQGGNQFPRIVFAQQRRIDIFVE